MQPERERLLKIAETGTHWFGDFASDKKSEDDGEAVESHSDDCFLFG